MNREAWGARRAQWQAFNQWEASQPARSLDLDEAWAWYVQAWCLARDVGAIPREPRIDPVKMGYIATVRARLARLPWPA